MSTRTFTRGFGSSPVALNGTCKTFQPNKASAATLRHLNFTKVLPYAKGQQVQEQFRDANVQFKRMMRKISLKKREMDSKELLMNDYEAELLANIVSAKPGPTLLSFQFDPVFTGGRREKDRVSEANVQALKSLGYDFAQTNRGGEITFHNPGQLVLYPILDLQDFDQLTVRCLVSKLEEAVVNTLNKFGVQGQRTNNTGVWVNEDTKISSIGLSLTRSITSHGVSINVCNEIPPIERANMVFCGLPGKRQTTLKEQIDGDISVDTVAREFSRQLAKALGIHSIETVDLEDLQID